MKVEQPTWVLLRGLTRERRHWGAFPAMLADACPGARVLPLDLPGNGALHLQPSPRSIETMAMHCRDALLHQGLAPPYRVLAMSMGAMVAIAWAARFPGEIDAAVLINTSVRPFSRPYQRLRPRNYASMLRIALADPKRVGAERLMLKMTSHRHRDDARRRERPVSRANGLAQLWAAARFAAPLESPFSRLLLLTSAQDRLVDTRCSIALSRAWRCALRSHPSAGHDLPLDEPEWVVQEVARWCADAP
jgi:pimeloyl-ACP methyl ester carboxylesterase